MMLRPCASERLSAGTSAVMTAAPLRIDRRETSVGGTRAVVSSQQLMNGSPENNLSLRRQSSTQPKGLKAQRNQVEIRFQLAIALRWNHSSREHSRRRFSLCHFYQARGHESGRVAAFSQAPVCSSSNGMSASATRA